MQCIKYYIRASYKQKTSRYSKCASLQAHGRGFRFNFFSCISVWIADSVYLRFMAKVPPSVNFPIFFFLSQLIFFCSGGGAMHSRKNVTGLSTHWKNRLEKLYTNTAQWGNQSLKMAPNFWAQNLYKIWILLWAKKGQYFPLWSGVSSPFSHL